ncbi:glucose-1-phosphate cytidylyltransferase [Methylobacterium pseudosasicola]|uniref:Glucose-1-phosphate cytidylyltransferase n=1 Tax=Methylobacterium pseudosasicola TaxID=582667 RepID=A0A1I4JMD5_9HYPH|nr:glucose-1-phosphate cytidylyltransferase [Methylobacterium pseudosasicola]SFL67710.1 glucose-1-phosphate cytidylyltransferase [Methylobacterium pseudosasicola]
MKAVILAGGLGTRLSEETATRPKPMVEIGGRPILWHIMKGYSQHGINDFVICLGYKGYVIKEYFANYFLHMSDVTIHIAENQMDIHRRTAEPWTVTLVDTGDHSMTGGRLKRVRHHIEGEEMFALTYGDGVSDVDFTAQIAFHRAHGKRATVTAVRPDKRFGYLALDGERVTAFEEKPDNEGGWINGGFFLLSPSVVDAVEGDETIWERAPLERLALAGELQAFAHDGFWQAMDTLRDKTNLEALWASGQAPWKTW